MVPEHYKTSSRKESNTCRWLFKTNYKADGTIKTHKARLVIQRRRHQKGIDSEYTITPVAKITTVISIFVVAATKDWHVYQMDVTNTFLHGELEEGVYMKLQKDIWVRGSLFYARKMQGHPLMDLCLL